VIKTALLTGVFFLAATLVTLSSSGNIHAQGAITGWEKDSSYDKLFDPKERDTLKGRLLKFIKVTPLPGMAPGTAFILEESKDEKILVHLCPASFATAKETGFKKGDKVKVKGSWAEIDGEDVFIAAKVKKGDHFQFKVRLTSDGTAYWTMSPEQLAKERKEE